VAACRAAFERRGCTYLDGAVSGHPEDVGASTSQILVAGAEEAWLTHRATIELLAGRTVYLGATEGSASAIDLAISGCFQTISLCAFLEAAAYLVSFDVDVEILRPQAIRLLEKMKIQVDGLVTAIATRDFSTDQATIDVYRAALGQVSSSMATAGVPGRLTSAGIANLDAALVNGRGADGLAAQIEYLRTLD
jgi:3-hydroxyisobutyrate dehydrogenase-like beta-hydroxyacid dehydrogenase